MLFCEDISVLYAKMGEVHESNQAMRKAAEIAAITRSE
jgi:hypothetical protein